MFSDCEWIWGGDGNPDEYIDFKIDLNIFAGKDYRLDLSCDTDYALYDGDKLLAFGQYPDYIDYKVYDSLKLDLESGEHSLLLKVWYQGANTQTAIKKTAGVIFCVFENGNPTVRSNKDIESRRSAGYLPYECKLITGQLGYSFAYDKSAKPGRFSPSHTVGCLPKTLVKRPIEKLLLKSPFNSKCVMSGEYLLNGGDTCGRKMLNARLSPSEKAARFENGGISLSASENANGIFAVFDMGRETAGFLNLDITVDEPCDIVVGWGEHLLDGRVRTAIDNRDFTCLYRTATGENRFLHPFRRLGCRYLQVFISAKSAYVASVSICETVYPVTPTPLECKDMLR